VTVLARKGYRATPRPDAVQVRAYETVPMLLLEQATVPNAFPMHIASLAFPRPGKPGRMTILARVRTSGLQYALDHVGGYAARMTVLARVKDSAGVATGYVSERYDITGPAPELETSRRGEVLFYKEIDLTPGIHTLEVIAYDETARRASVRIATVDVPDPGKQALPVSSLVLVRSAERVPTDRQGSAPALRFGEWLLTPNVEGTVSRGADIAFAVALYPGSTALPVNATVGLFRNGQQVAAAPLVLAAPGPDGRVSYVGRLPLGGLEVGTCQLGVRITQGNKSATRLTTFTIVDDGAPEGK
jgi:hypothetical protein